MKKAKLVFLVDFAAYWFFATSSLSSLLSLYFKFLSNTNVFVASLQLFRHASAALIKSWNYRVLIRYRSDDMIASAIKYLNSRIFIFIDDTLSLQSKRMMKRILKYSKHRFQQSNDIQFFKIFCAFKNRL